MKKSKRREVDQFMRELADAGFEIRPRTTSWQVFAPPSHRDLPGSMLFIHTTPSCYRYIPNTRAWAERYGLPKKRRN